MSDEHERRTFVLEAPISRVLWSLSWPIIVANQLSILSLGVQLFWFGRLAGENGLVVEALFRPFGLLVGWMFGSTAVGAAALVSRSVGARDGRGLSLAASSVTLTAVMWLVFAAIAVPLAPLLTELLIGPLSVATPMLHYMIAWLLVALPGFAIAGLLLDVVCSTGATQFNLARVVVDLVMMAALVPLLMSGFGLGLIGGPLSEGIAALALAPFLWRALLRRREALGLGELAPGAWKLRRASSKEILAIGFPVQAGRLAGFAAQIALLRLVTHDGEAAVAGYGVALAILLFAAITTEAVAGGGAIAIGQALGAGLHARARRTTRVAVWTGWAVMGLFVVATVLFDRELIGVFTTDHEIVEAGRRALHVVRWAGFGGAAFQVLLGAFAAHRATVRASVLMIASDAISLIVAFAWPGPHLDAACVAVVVANGLKGALLLGLWLWAPPSEQPA